MLIKREFTYLTIFIFLLLNSYVYAPETCEDNQVAASFNTQYTLCLGKTLLTGPATSPHYKIRVAQIAPPSQDRGIMADIEIKNERGELLGYHSYRGIGSVVEGGNIRITINNIVSQGQDSYIVFTPTYTGSAATTQTGSCPARIDVFDYNLIVNKIAKIKAISNKAGRISIFAEGLGPNALKVCNDATECNYLSGSENPAYPNGVNLPTYYAGITVRYYAELVTSSGERISSSVKEARVGDQSYQNNFCADENSIVIGGGTNTPGARCTYAQQGQCNPGYCKRSSSNQVECDYPNSCINNDALRTLVPLCPTTDVVCTQDVQQCPDGSFVGRDPQNNCRFRQCPNCGNGVQDAGETCSTCHQDMPTGSCNPQCGNGVPDSGETCSTCPQDVIAAGGSCPTTTGTAGLTFSTSLNRPDSSASPAQYSSSKVLEWNYRLNNNGPSFNANVCFFLKDPDNNYHDITGIILNKANEQHCNNRNPQPGYCPISLTNREIGTTNQEVAGQILKYTFPNTGGVGAYQLIAQLREPNVGCSNSDGSIINAVPIATSTNYLKFLRTQAPPTKTTTQQKPKIKVFLLLDVNTCIVGNQCTTDDCMDIKDLRTDQVVKQFNKTGLLALPPTQITSEQRNSAYCMNLKFNPAEIDAVRNEVSSFREIVIEYSRNKINPEIQIINIDNGAGIEMAQYGTSFWVPPGGVHKAISSFYSLDTDFTFVVTDIKDPNRGVYFDPSLCDGSIGSQYNYGIGYTWMPKWKDGPGCANNLTFVHGFLHQLANAVNKINPPPSPFVSYVENNYLYNGQRLSCSTRFDNPYSYFPDADVAPLDPDFDSCRGNFGDNWIAGYCASLVAQGFDGEECNRRWDKHLLGDHFPDNYALIGNSCRNGKQDISETGIDTGGQCSVYTTQTTTQTGR